MQFPDDANGRAHAYPSGTMDRAANLWFLVEEFFTSRTIYNEIHERYERMVLKYSRERGVDRKVLRLNAEELAGLLNFKELEDLRNNHLFPLKTLSHGLFRGVDTTDKFDRYVSDLFHEISILKEEQYKVRTYAPEYEATQEDDELESILAEVHEFFPQKVHHIHNLFRKAQGRLEEILPAHNRERVLVRSMYLYGEDVFAPVYAGGLEEVYGMVFPEGGAAEGYLEAARSFLGAGFLEEGRIALQRVMEVVDRIEEPAPRLVDFRAEAEHRLRQAAAVAGGKGGGDAKGGTAAGGQGG